jgi:SAM-dependent methyltransferase
MWSYEASTYGERIAGIYDSFVTIPAAETEACVGLLADLAGAGPALELGIGTGRVALPLAARGIPMCGIDASPSMVARLRAKPGGEAIPVAVGDFAVAIDGGPYTLVYVVFNTFFALLSQEEQVRCFAGVAAHLAADGAFVLKAFVPVLARFTRGQNVQLQGIDAHAVRLDVAQHDPVRQRVRSQHVHFSAAGIQLYPVEIRYAWLSELDLMAQLAGLRLRERWGGWEREPFTAASARHVSVYARGTGRIGSQPKSE